MKSASVGELKENLDQFLDLVQSGERIEITNGTERVAYLEPVRTTEERDLPTDDADKTMEEIIDQLVASGVVTRGTGDLPSDFLTRPLPKLGFSLLESILEDRKAD
jgi:antitoxin (DNA-binding transcriptional repressor) of toxin-antitoxin stability system